MENSFRTTIVIEVIGSVIYISENGADSAEYAIADDSLESAAHSIGNAVADYLEGIG